MENYTQRIENLIARKSTMDSEDYLEKLKNLRFEILTSIVWDTKDEIENDLIKSVYKIINK